MTYRVFDGKELVTVTSSCIGAYAVAEGLNDPRVEDEAGNIVLHPEHRKEPDGR